MATKRTRIVDLEHCSRNMFGDMIMTYHTPTLPLPKEFHVTPNVMISPQLLRRSSAGSVVNNKWNKNFDNNNNNKRRASALVEQLLLEIYSACNNTTTDYNSCSSSHKSKKSSVDLLDLQSKSVEELRLFVSCLDIHVERCGNVLVRQLKRRDALRRQRDARCDVITSLLRKRFTLSDQSDRENTREGNSANMRFTIQPSPGESGYAQWAAAMKMVATLPGGIPPEFRRRLWLSLADKHLLARNIDWPQVEKTCFSEWSHPTDSELGVQIVKDLHRTGCSLFCGKDGQENQALLKKVLLAYARWNKDVGYCQGFNMLAALILQVTEKCETDALKLMIYLIEGVLPESYFADSLRGLSVDMAVFRELLRTRLPRLSRHLDTLQNASKEGTTSYEPPLTNVFTMQWFLTLFCNCLPQPTVLRVWDLILLEGNEILLRTALAIWQTLADRILTVRSADEFYCMMGVLTRELLEFNLIDANTLVKAIVTIGPLTELKNLRDHYLYNINPWGSQGVKQVYSDTDKQIKVYPKDRLILDISALKKQYLKLKQRQRQAHIIFSAAINRQAPSTNPPVPVAMNHLLLGKTAIVSARRLGPPKGAVPPARQPQQPPQQQVVVHASPRTLHWKDEPTKQCSSSSSSDTELCDEDDASSSSEEQEEAHSSPVQENNSQLAVDNPLTSSSNSNNPEKEQTNPDLMMNDNTNRSSMIDRLSDLNSDLVTTSDNPSISVPNCSDTFVNYSLEDSCNTSLSPIPVSDSIFKTYSHVDDVNTNQIITFDDSDIFDRASTSINTNKSFSEKSPRNELPLSMEFFSEVSSPVADSLMKFDDVDVETTCKELTESDDDFDFEDFLRDRMSCLNKNAVLPEDDEKETDRITYGRRNSERALQIIQENSLILHRILQCQSRLSPSPPLVSTFEDMETPTINDSLTITNDGTPKLIHAVTSTTSTPQQKDNASSSFICLDNITTLEQNQFITKVNSDEDLSEPRFTLTLNKTPVNVTFNQEEKSPEYGSKYTSILEKSKNLDEKYYSLIGNAVVKKRPLSLKLDDFDINILINKHGAASDNFTSSLSERQVKSTPISPVDDFKSLSEISTSLLERHKFVKSSSTTEQNPSKLRLDTVEIKCQNVESPQISNCSFSTNLDDIVNSKSSIIDDVTHDVSTSEEKVKATFNEFPNESCNDSTNNLDGCEVVDISNKNSPLDDSKKAFVDGANTKSPNKLFSPFPVQVNYRQNKDVAVKLGMYKK